MDNKQEKLLQIGNEIFGVFSSSECCPLDFDIDCEDCKLISVCDLIVNLEDELSQKGAVKNGI